ncbi:hypothetical protein PGB90_008725 [Kerria lacca]
MEYTAKKIDSEEESTPILKKCKISKSIDEKTRERRVTDKVNTSSSPTTKKIRVATNNTTYRFESANSSVATAIVVAPSPGKDGKRANKPLMEKRRRARINQSLALLKTLILDSTKNDNTRHSKLEKADILELTVRYLQRQKILNSDVLDKYKAGFQECTREVTRFLDTPELHLCGESHKSLKSHGNGSYKSSNSIFTEPAVKQRLLRHLNSCNSEIDLDFSKSTSLHENQTISKLSAELHSIPSYSSNDITIVKRETSSVKNEDTESEAEYNIPKNKSFENSNDSTLSVVQVIPSRLSDGQVVFLLPSHYMQLAEEFQKKTTYQKRNNENFNEPLDFSIKRDDSMWRPW